ncbi:phage holin family protein [Fulvivirga sedimenti]|uniref:Phage holin family protein n=1 Tax=Fulvivirga sedimenti TaxID=2879465 RepID=A0A9X1HLT7_9BACT|nr:phage holin family protein [Fulvivirga sedimenti]MCA6073345.1 phage holin family protein [Fulvivirga sedimenti]
MRIIIKFLFTALAVFATGYLLPGITVESLVAAIFVAVVLAILNTFLKPVLVALTIPLTILTLGLFLLVINAVIILIAGYFVDGFVVANFWWALLFSIIVSIIMSVYDSATKK